MRLCKSAVTPTQVARTTSIGAKMFSFSWKISIPHIPRWASFREMTHAYQVRGKDKFIVRLTSRSHISTLWERGGGENRLTFLRVVYSTGGESDMVSSLVRKKLSGWSSSPPIRGHGRGKRVPTTVTPLLKGKVQFPPPTLYWPPLLAPWFFSPGFR